MKKSMLGDNLKRIRLEQSLTQADLASAANINRRYYQSIEANRQNPTIFLLSRIRKALKCEWTDVLKSL